MSEQAHLSAFASPVYRRYFPGAVFSTLGSWTLRFLLGWSAWNLTESAVWVGAVAGLMLAPALLLSPLFGIVSDRINPRNGLLVTVSLHGALAAIASFTSLSGLFGLPALLLISAGLGLATSAHTPFRLAMVPSLVPRGSLPSAIGYSATTFNTSRILGPALGAWLLQLGSPALAFISAALLTLFALPFLYAIPGRVPQQASGQSHGFYRQMLGGLAYTRSHEAIRLVFGFTLVNALLGRTVIEMLPAVSGQLLDGDAATLATLTASAGAGAILGGLVISRQTGSEQRLLKILGASLLLNALLVASLGWLDHLLIFVTLIGAVSLLTTMAGTTSQALVQLQVDDAYRGRVLSLWSMIAMGAPAIGALIMGGLVDLWSFPTVLPGFALAGLAVIARLLGTQGATRTRDRTGKVEYSMGQPGGGVNEERND